MNNLTRVELIDPTGRVIVYYGKASAQIQDGGRTLKVFCEDCVAVPKDSVRDRLAQLGMAVVPK